MAIDFLPEFIRANYQIMEVHHASAILERDFPQEWNDMCAALMAFRLKRSHIVKPGGRKSQVATTLDSFLYNRGWREKHFDTRITVDGHDRVSPTHSIDCYKNNIGIEIEWNNKDPFYDRDLNNFRLLFQLKTISVGVIITRCTELQAIFDELGRGDSYGSSTTHFGKLIPKLNGGGSGGCPVLAFGITRSLYDPDG